MRTTKGLCNNGPRAAINVTPLIDVLLVLLIIFMIISPSVAKLPVRAPQPVGPDLPPNQDETLTLSVISDETVSLNGRNVAIGTLPELLSKLMQELPADQRTLFVRASGFTRYDSVLLFVDIARGAGVSNIALLTGEDSK